MQQRVILRACHAAAASRDHAAGALSQRLQRLRFHASEGRFAALRENFRNRAARREKEIECEIFQSNHEGALVDKIQEAYGVFDGIVINPAAYTHTSVAILDALKAVAIPAVEVHLSDVRAREPFRQISYAGMACVKTYMGLGFDGYREAIRFLKAYLQK